ncbi:MAG: nickel pincer cofactor biosynthesis protein LarC [Pirellulaceae bacterium]|nr:nickel pincer cofactor biosynthesis protein LarC [Pirellulaceae bacterium]
MRIAYLDCASGISGDMTLGALVDAGVPLERIQAGIDSLGLAACRLEATEVRKRGFRATQITVHHEPEHAHRHLHHITDMIDASQLTDSQKQLARRIFTRLGEAEAQVHGTTIRKVHFHEVGAVDSIADIVGSAIGWDLLGVDRVECSPIPTGTGFIEIAHGRVSIPAPATAELLKGIPLAASDVAAELTTPTGAAIVATLSSRFGPLPAMRIERIGCGAGQRDLDAQPNLVRLLVGTVDEPLPGDEVWQLETNLDDVSGEVIAHCAQQLLDSGALDVYTTPIQMKKNRPAVKLSVLAERADLERLEGLVFRETGTLGVRRWLVSRHKLPRRIETVATDWGPVEVKVAQLADGSRRCAPEFEACRRLAQQHGVPLQQIYDAARAACQPPAT